MGGGMEVDLSHGAVAAMAPTAEGPRAPVLQVADAPRAGVSAMVERFFLVLSDGIHALKAALATSLNHLVRGGRLRRGSVIRVLDYVTRAVRSRRVIILIQLEILQTECALIGSPIMYEANATRPNGVSCSGGVGSHEPCALPGTQLVIDKSSCFPGQGMLHSSFAPRAEHPVNSLQRGGCYGSMALQNTVDAKMQQLSLDDHQNRRFSVTTTGGNFGRGSTYGSPLPPSYLPSPKCPERSHGAMNDALHQVIPVATLNPYQARWTIKARVTAKTDLKHYSNTRGPGKVFSFDLIDAEGGETRATCFNLQADEYFDLIEVDKVYLISRGAVKYAQKKYNPLNSDFEILVDHTTSIEICPDDDSSIPRQQYHFRQISEMENIEDGSLVDLLGVVTSVSASSTILRKDGKEIKKRTLQLKDMSGRSMEIILWDKFCDGEGQQLQWMCDSGSNPVLSLKGCRISDFRGRSLVTISSTQLKVNPDFPEAERLRQWYLTEGKTAACFSLSHETSSMSRDNVWKSIEQIKNDNLGRSGKPDLITVRAMLAQVNADNFCYPACTLEVNGKQCNKKVTRNSDRAWYCDRCVQDSPNCEYRYLLMCKIQDHTGVTYATAFQEAGTKIIGYSACELFNLRNQDEAQFAEIIQGVCWQQFLFKLKVKEEPIYGELRVRCDIVAAEKLDASAANHRLLKEIDNLLKDVSRSTLEDVSCNTPNVGSVNLEVGQGLQPTNNAYHNDMSVRGAGYGHSAGELSLQAGRYGKMSAPLSGLSVCSARNGGFMDWSRPPARYGSLDPCFTCKEPGHWARDCPLLMPAPLSGLSKCFACHGGFMDCSRPSAGNGNLDPCFRCKQPGHWARDCPVRST